MSNTSTKWFAATNSMLVVPRRMKVDTAEIGPIVYVNKNRSLFSHSSQCPLVVMMPCTLHPMALEPWLLQWTLLVSPSHCNTFTEVIHISHQLSCKGCTWNCIWFKKQYPRGSSTKGSGSVGTASGSGGMSQRTRQWLQLCRIKA